MRLRVFPDPQALALAASGVLERLCADAVARKGVFTLALSGGETPKALFRVLRAAPHRLDWEHCRIFWADERCVPPDHPRSNYGQAAGELLQHVPAGRVFRMAGEKEPRAAACAYETILRDNVDIAEQGVPGLDCILLGMGEDGHTASLFPGRPELEEREKLVLDVAPPGLEPRLTLSVPVLNAAATCLVLVSGTAKHPALRRALDLSASAELPIQRVRPIRGELCFMADQAAFQG